MMIQKSNMQILQLRNMPGSPREELNVYHDLPSTRKLLLHELRDS